MAAVLVTWLLLPETRTGNPVTGTPQPVPA
jgi:hypothetical protein